VTEDHPNVYRVETKSASCLDIEVLKADVVLRGADTDDLVASLKPGGRKRGQMVGLDVHQEGDTIFIRSIDNQKLSRQTLTVEVPSVLRTIRARMSRGDLRVSGLAEVDLNLGVDKGDTRLTELSGRIHLDARHGDIEARTLAGRIELSVGSGDVKISEASGDWIRLNTGHGDVIIERVTGNTLCKLGRGDVITKNLGGEVEITSGAGDIVLSAMDALKAHVSSGAGDILVHKGSLRELSASTRRGDITLQAELLEGKFDLTSKSGDVKVVLQPDANVRFEAATTRGDLVSDVPGVKVGRPGPASRAGGRLVGVIGDGRARLSLHTNSGDVRIRFPKGYKRERDSMRAEPADTMQDIGHNWQVETEAIRVDKESLRAAMEAARGAMLATKEPLREALTATREVVETSLQQGTASVLRATEEALQITTSVLRDVEEALQDLGPRSDVDDEDAVGPATSPMSSATEGGIETGPKDTEQPPTADNGAPSSVDSEPGVGALEDTLQAAKNTIMSALNQVRESATHAWEEALRAVEIRPEWQEGHEWDREHPCSQPGPNAEGAKARETASLDREHPCSQPPPDTEGAETRETRSLDREHPCSQPPPGAEGAETRETRSLDREHPCSQPPPDTEGAEARETASLDREHPCSQPPPGAEGAEGQAAPPEEATALRILEALQAREIDVGEAERLLAQL